MEVRNETEARDWFLEHSSGGVVCISQNGSRSYVTTYAEAQWFFREFGECSAGASDKH